MSLVDPSRFAPWHCPPPLFRNIELGRIEVSSGRLAIRDVYDRDHPQVVLNVAPGNYRVWSTELDLRANPRGPLFRPAYLSIQLSDAPRKRIDFPEDLYGTPAPPYGIGVSTDLGMILLHDAEALSLTSSRLWTAAGSVRGKAIGIIRMSTPRAVPRSSPVKR